MNRRIAILFGLLTFFFGAWLRAETDEEVEAHKLVLDITGAFTNEGFKLRDGHWTGIIKPHEHKLVAVNLYAGNQYWFSAAAANAKAKKIAVDLYDESGKPLTTENYCEGERASAGFSPTTSGQYFVAVRVEGEPSTVCLVYSYK